MPSCSHEQQHNRYLPRQVQLSYCPSLSLEGYSWYSDGPEPTVCYSHCWICTQLSAVYAHYIRGWSLPPETSTLPSTNPELAKLSLPPLFCPFRMSQIWGHTVCSLCRSGPWTCSNPLALASWVLRLQVCTTWLMYSHRIIQRWNCWVQRFSVLVRPQKSELLILYAS